MNYAKTLELAEFHGDGIAQELSSAVHEVAESLPIKIVFHPIDLSLNRRRKNTETPYQEAEEAINKYRIALKYPTITEQESPNKILRDRFGFSVIHRPVRTILGVTSRHSCKVNLDIIRIAVGGTYEDAGRRIGNDSAVSIRVIERKPSQEAAKFAFALARKLKKTVVSTSKYTIQRATDGLFEEICKEVAEEHQDVGHKSELFDALLAKLIMNPESYRIIVTPNEYGDFLSDAACGLVGSIGLGASASYAFNKDGTIRLAMFDPAGGTAPDIAGKNLCNPSAALWALGMLLEHAGFKELGIAINEGVHDTIASSQTTKDLGGDLTTDAFTQVAIKTIAKKIAS